MYTSIKFCGLPRLCCGAPWATNCRSGLLFACRIPPFLSCLKNQSAVYGKPKALHITATVGILLLFSMTGFRRLGFSGRSNLTKSEMTFGGTTPFVILVVIIILVLFKGVCQHKIKNYTGLSYLHKRQKQFLCTNTSHYCVVNFGYTVYCGYSSTVQ